MLRRGRAGRVARRQVRRQVRHNRQVGAYYQQPQQAAAKPEQSPAPAPVKEEKKVIVECEFPRCEKLPEYGFKDGRIAQFCIDHKSDEMVLLVADPDKPKESSIDLVKKYLKLEKDLEPLKEAPAKYEACKAEIKRISAKVYNEEIGINQLTKEMKALDVKVEEESSKPKLFGRGIFGRDQYDIDKWTKEKEQKGGKIVEIKGEKEMNELKLAQLKEKLPGLMKLADEYTEINNTMKKYKTKAIEDEASALYLALKAAGFKKKKELQVESEIIFQRLKEKVAAEE